MAKPLDILITAFASEQHPLVVVGLHATRWMGARAGADENTLDLLIRDSSSPAIISTLLSSSSWCLSHDVSDLSYLPPADISAVTRLTAFGGLWLLTLWPERVYGLRADGPLIQVPDFSPLNSVLIETEMDPGCPQGPRLLSDKTTRFVWRKSDLPDALLVQTSLPGAVEIFIPTVASFLEALCGQASRRPDCLPTGRGAKYVIDLRIRYLFLEQEGQRRKLEQRLEKNANWDFLNNHLDNYVRTNKRTGESTRGGKVWKSEFHERLRRAWASK